MVQWKKHGVEQAVHKCLHTHGFLVKPKIFNDFMETLPATMEFREGVRSKVTAHTKVEAFSNSSIFLVVFLVVLNLVCPDNSNLSQVIKEYSNVRGNVSTRITMAGLRHFDLHRPLTATRTEKVVTLPLFSFGSL